MALYVLQDGCPFEQAVMLKEQANPEFAFLFDLKSPEHVYYRWRLYSLANEDSLMRWHVEPFWLVEETARYASHWLLSSYTGFDDFQEVLVLPTSCLHLCMQAKADSSMHSIAGA